MPALATLDPAARLGPKLARQRLALEAQLWKRKQHSQGARLIRATVKTGLAVLGLSRRAYRNFLDVRLVENVVRIPSLPPAFEGFRLLQITDLHSDLDPQLIDCVIGLLQNVSFDQCVLTGDYHNEIGTLWDRSMEHTLRLIPHLGTRPLGVPGNHDFLAKFSILEEGGLRMLLNESVSLERNGARLWICGVDDAHLFRTHDLEAACRDIPAAECRILLSHTPETWQEAARLGYALHLSGHTHGGQICLPGGYPIIRKAAVPRALLAGPWRVDDMAGYTSRGTGSCSVAARLNCPPEITLHILRRP
jgi:predicted MPP superfamily phosphohydrolase